MRLTKRRTGVLLVLAAVLLLAAFAFRPKPVAVQSAVAEAGQIVTTVDEDGVTRVADRYILTAPINGDQLRVRFKAGDAVASGDVIAEIRPASLDPRTLSETNARLDAAVDNARSATAAVSSARSLLADAERERGRVERLSSIVARSDIDRARTLAAERRAELNAAVARAEVAKHETELIRATLAAAENGSVLRLRAPAGGRILRVPSESEATVAAGTTIAEIGDPKRLEVVIDVLSADAVRVHGGQEVIVEGWGGEAPLRAMVERVEPSGFMKVSALGIEEQRVNVIARLLDPPASLGDRFRVDTSVVIWKGNVLRVPMTALFRDGDGWAVFAIRAGRARLQRVDVGHRGKDDIEIVRGLQRGDAVIVHPSDRISDGTRVKPERGA